MRCLPIRLIKAIPSSYSTYLKFYTPRAGDIVLDCGAHIGNCSILFSRLVGKTGTVIALEPFRDSFDILKKRINRHKLGNVLAINKAVWNRQERLSLELFSDTISCRISEHPNCAENQDKHASIECISIDDLVQVLKLEHLDLVKMDIEGAEIEALEGASHALDKHHPHVAVASYHIRDGEPTSRRVEKLLKNQGYTTKSVFPPHLTTCGEK
jgi:FkbM family methyltransferase